MIDYIFPVVAYLLGSIPFGLVLSKIFGYGDIRNIGSGNIGATNVLRTGNKKLAILVLILDIGKGFAAVRLAFLSENPDIILISAFMVVLGHMYPVWLKFKGGKGVATSLGVFGAIMPPLGMWLVSIWLLTAAVFRRSSLAALTAFAVSPFLSIFFWPEYKGLAVLAAVIMLLVFWKHRENIRRLIKGEEPKISFGKK